MKKEDAGLLLRDIGCRIAELRAERGWTQQQLSERLDVSVRYLARLERGQQNLTVKRLAWLAGHLGVRTVDLFAPPATRTVRIGRPPRPAR